jgi:hypothetical protein
VRFPLGDIVRAFNPKGWLGWIFSKTKGLVIRVKGHDIVLDERHTIDSNQQPLDKPHEPGR